MSNLLKVAMIEMEWEETDLDPVQIQALRLSVTSNPVGGYKCVWRLELDF